MASEKLILGIDPGTINMGFGLIAVSGKQNMKHVFTDTLHLHKLNDPHLKLKKIFERTLAIIDQYHPDEIAIEAPFFGKNVQSMLKLGRAQGVAMAAGLYREIPVVEYSPRKIKQSITGKGSASKEQVALMLKSLGLLEVLPKHLDETDGLAVAVCHFFQGGNGAEAKSYKGWDSFLKNNPDRLA